MELLAQGAAAGRTLAEGLVGDRLDRLEAVVAGRADVRIGGHRRSFGTRPSWHSPLTSAKVYPVAGAVSAVCAAARRPTVGGMEARERQTLAVVAAGGALGGLSRWLVGLAVPWQPPDLPLGTLTVNLVGCVAIGFLLTLWTEGPAPPWWARPFAAVGFVGGFTTFSAFAVEGVRLVDAGAPGTALGYVVLSVVVGVLLVRVSSVLTRRLIGPARGEA